MTYASTKPQDEDLLQLLRGLHRKHFDSEFDFTREVVPAFVKQLGYAEAETFYEYPADRWRVDVVLSPSVESTPWIVIEVKTNPRPKNPGDWAYLLRRYLIALRCGVGVVISPELFILFVDDKARRFDLRSITIEDVSEIRAALERGAQSLTVSEGSPRGKMVELIEAVEQAISADAKGQSLEALARFLFNSVPSLSAKYSNLQTRSSEIDIVVEYDRRKGEIGLFEELGRYCLVECKNWSKPVGVSPVRDFLGKLDKCKTRLGIIFSKNGVTGVDSGADALREIQSRFDRDGVYLLVFSMEDLKGVKTGATFIKAIDKKADSLRFDAEDC